MQRQLTRRMAYLVGTAAAAVWIAAPALSAQQADPERQQEVILEHIDEADELVASMLSWRHALTRTVRDPDNETPRVPERPANTLMNVERADAERLVALITAISALTPRTEAQAAQVPRGDLRAHVEKALEISRELLPAGQRPVGTTGGGNLVTIDRTTLERLEVELDAMEAVAPRSVQPRAVQR